MTAGGASLANAWNTPAALSRQSADARIDTLLADFGLSLKPANGLDVRGKLRYYETSNSMQYQSCNPLTGQWGRLLNDGSGLSLVTANTSRRGQSRRNVGQRLQRRQLQSRRGAGAEPRAVGRQHPDPSAPYDYRQLNREPDRRLPARPRLQRQRHRSSARPSGASSASATRPGRTSSSWPTSTAARSTARSGVSYEHDRRGGSDYNPNPYQPFLSASLGPTPAANNVALADLVPHHRAVPQLRPRRPQPEHPERAGRLRAAAEPGRRRDAADEGCGLSPASCGRTGHQKTNSVTFDLSYQAGLERGALRLLLVPDRHHGPEGRAAQQLRPREHLLLLQRRAGAQRRHGRAGADHSGRGRARRNAERRRRQFRRCVRLCLAHQPALPGQPRLGRGLEGSQRRDRPGRQVRLRHGQARCELHAHARAHAASTTRTTRRRSACRPCRPPSRATASPTSPSPRTSSTRSVLVPLTKRPAAALHRALRVRQDPRLALRRRRGQPDAGEQRGLSRRRPAGLPRDAGRDHVPHAADELVREQPAQQDPGGVRARHRARGRRRALRLCRGAQRARRPSRA